MIVMKFGGSSLESAEALDRVTNLIAAQRQRNPVVVVSAMGKTTNRLLSAARLAASGRRDQALQSLRELHAYHVAEAGAVAPAARALIDGHFAELEELLRGIFILGELTPRSLDAIGSYGERLSSAILTLLLQQKGTAAAHVDARDLIVTDGRHMQAQPLLAETYDRLARTVPPLANGHAVVMGGFIGATLAGVTTTLGRGGSDFSASLVAAGIDAEEIQIWTDVDGMLTVDPRIFPGGHRVRTISFAEAAELAYFGAKVLHPSTMLPAIEKQIPVLILNSRRPDVEGTRIIRDPAPSRSVAKSIACKRNITVLNVHSTRMLMAYGFLRRIFEVFDRYETPVDMVATSEVSVSLTIDDTERLEPICHELRQIAEVSVERDGAIVCLVGENIRHTPGVASRVFQALQTINVRMISQGASLLNLSVVVAEADLRVAVANLHAEFFSEPDPAIFAANA